MVKGLVQYETHSNTFMKIITELIQLNGFRQIGLHCAFEVYKSTDSFSNSFTLGVFLQCKTTARSGYR